MGTLLKPIYLNTSQGWSYKPEFLRVAASHLLQHSFFFFLYNCPPLEKNHFVSCIPCIYKITNVTFIWKNFLGKAWFLAPFFYLNSCFDFEGRRIVHFLARWIFYHILYFIQHFNLFSFNVKGQHDLYARFKDIKIYISPIVVCLFFN